MEDIQKKYNKLEMIGTGNILMFIEQKKEIQENMFQLKK